jgi:transposase
VGEGSFYGLLAKREQEWFRDEDFVGLYREDFGRPSVPPSQLAIALLLQSHDGVSDEEAIERSAYDLRWKVALGLGLDAKLCAKSTLQLFRAKLILHEAHEALFERSVRACREAGLLGKRRKVAVAIDTTPVLGRGAVRDTYNLVSDAIRQVVVEAGRLKGWVQAEVVEQQGLGRHFAPSFKGAVDLDWSDPPARRALVGRWWRTRRWRWRWRRRRCAGLRRRPSAPRCCARRASCWPTCWCRTSTRSPRTAAAPPFATGPRGIGS